MPTDYVQSIVTTDIGQRINSISQQILSRTNLEKIIKALGLKESNGFVAPANLETEENVVVGDHVYACGTALGPAEVPESVTQARAVVSKILQGRK